MKTVLFATRTVPGLAPLTDSCCVALLSVGCKPLIVHTVESLAMAGLTDVIVIVSPGAAAVKPALGDGARWGMRFTYEHAVAGESDDRIVDRIREKLGEEFLLVRGEIMRTPIVAEFVERARLLRTQQVIATIGGVEAGLSLFSLGRDAEVAISGELPNAAPATSSASRIEFPDARLSYLDSLAAFHSANLDLLAGHFGGLIIPGREAKPKVRVGRHSHLPGGAVKGPPVLIGSRCRIADDAELGASVVISDDVIIDSRAILRSAVIMPNTYVGELVEVANAIVDGDRLIHVDTGTVVTVTDNFLLANTRTNDLGARLRAFFDRTLQAVLVAAAFWRWPKVLVSALSEGSQEPARGKLLLRNQKQDARNAGFKVPA